MDWELWGTFSVKDHLRPRAFVADVLLYDRLVVPMPPKDDEGEFKRWTDQDWHPERQRALLDLIGSERVIPVPWDESHRANWETRYQGALAEDRAGAKRGAERGAQPGAQRGAQRGAVRTEMAAAVAFDASNVRQAREQFAASGRPDADLDNVAYYTTRMLLADWSNRRNDAALFRSLPRVQVDAVTAYGSHAAFSRDYELVSRVGEPGAQPALLDVFGWRFLVPADSERTDEYLLQVALELAAQPETQRHRRLFHQWRRGEILQGRTPQEARQEMEDAIAGYKQVMTRSKIAKQARWACAVVSANPAAGSDAYPTLGMPGVFAGLGAYAVSEAGRQVVPQPLQFAAMFYDARRQFA